MNRYSNIYAGYGVACGIFDDLNNELYRLKKLIQNTGTDESLKTDDEYCLMINRLKEALSSNSIVYDYYILNVISAKIRSILQSTLKHSDLVNEMLEDLIINRSEDDWQYYCRQILGFIDKSNLQTGKDVVSRELIENNLDLMELYLLLRHYSGASAWVRLYLQLYISLSNYRLRFRSLIDVNKSMYITCNHDRLMTARSPDDLLINFEVFKLEELLSASSIEIYDSVSEAYLEEIERTWLEQHSIHDETLYCLEILRKYQWIMQGRRLIENNVS